MSSAGVGSMGLATKATLHTMYCYSTSVLKYRDSVGDRKKRDMTQHPPSHSMKCQEWKFIG